MKDYEGEFVYSATPDLDKQASGCAAKVFAEREAKSMTAPSETPMSPMKFIGEQTDGTKWYFADEHFDQPGIYYWDGKANIHAMDKIHTLERELNAAKREVEEANKRGAHYRALLYGCDKHGLWDGLSCIGCIAEERDQLLREKAELEKQLKESNDLAR